MYILYISFIHDMIIVDIIFNCVMGSIKQWRVFTNDFNN